MLRPIHSIPPLKVLVICLAGVIVLACGSNGPDPSLKRENPQGQIEIIGSMGGDRRGLAFVGDVLLLAEGMHLTRIDASDPTHPELIGRTRLDHPIVLLAVDGDFAYVVDSKGDLTTLKLGERAEPRVLGKCYALTNAHFLIPRGDTLIVGGLGEAGQRATARIFDIGVKETPKRIGHFTTAAVEANTKSRACVEGNRLFISDWQRTEIADISDPAAPRSAGDLIGYSVIAVEKGHPERVFSLYNDSLESLDISGLPRVAVLSSNRIGDDARRIFVDGMSFCVFPDENRSEIGRLFELGDFKSGISLYHPFDGERSISVRGKMVAMSAATLAVLLYDVSDSKRERLLGTWSTLQGRPSTFEKRGTVLDVAIGGPEVGQRIDVSDPRNPKLVSAADMKPMEAFASDEQGLLPDLVAAGVKQDGIIWGMTPSEDVFWAFKSRRFRDPIFIGQVTLPARPIKLRAELPYIYILDETGQMMILQAQWNSTK